MNEIKKEEVLSKLQTLVDTVSKAELTNDAHLFVQTVFQTDAVADFLIHVSRLPVFHKDFSYALSHDLDLLAICKKLK
jgi:hypothetical protein